MGKFNSKVEPSPGMDCVRSSRLHCTGLCVDVNVYLGIGRVTCLLTTLLSVSLFFLLLIPLFRILYQLLETCSVERQTD
jgi:hypothetical protein